MHKQDVEFYSQVAGYEEMIRPRFRRGRARASRRVTSVTMSRNIVGECLRTFSVDGDYPRVSFAQLCVGFHVIFGDFSCILHLSFAQWNREYIVIVMIASRHP